MSEGFITRCAYCKAEIEPKHARVVDFTPTGRMVTFHDACEALRGTTPPEQVPNREASVTRLTPTTRKLGLVPKPPDDGYDD